MAYFYHGNISPLELSVNGTSKFKGVDTSTPGILQIYDNDSTNYTQIQAPGTLSANYTLTLPTTDGDANQLLQTDGGGTLSWTNGITLSGSSLTGLIENNSIWLGNDPSSTTDTAEKNTAVGIGSLDAITTGDHNVAIGYNSGTAINSGYKNILLGSLAGQGITTGYQNIAVGTEAGYTLTEGYHNIYIGNGAGYSTTTPTENICVGTYTGQKITTGSKNTFVGQESGNSNWSIVALTGHENTCFGYKSGFNVQGASQYNTLIGSRSGDAITTGTEIVIVGYNSDPSSATGTNQIVIGSGTTGIGDNTVVIGNASVTDIYMASDAGATVRCGDIETSGDINLASGKEVKINGTNILSTIQSDITTLQNTDTSIQSSLNDKATISSVNDEISAREDADADLQGNIDLKSNIDDPTFTTKITTPSIDTPQLTNASTIALTSTAGAVNITSAAAVSITSGSGNTTINTPSMLVTHTAHSDLTVKSTNTTDGEAYLTLISDNAGDAGDGWRLKSVNGVLTISSDHNSSGTYGETILTMTGHDTDASRTTTITGNLDVSAGVNVTGSITCSVDLDIEGDIDMASYKNITWITDDQYIGGTPGGIAIQSPGSITLSAPTLFMGIQEAIFLSQSTGTPVVLINSQSDDATGPILKFSKSRYSCGSFVDGQNNDVCGTIIFNGNDDDDSPTNKTFGEIKVISSAVASGSEKGTMTIGVACTGDGGVDTVLTLEGGVDEASSTTTVAGNLSVGGSVVNLANIPTSASGLSSGDIWSNSGVLTIVA